VVRSMTFPLPTRNNGSEGVVAGDSDSRPAMVRVAIVRVGQLLQHTPPIMDGYQS
jgi:hypothetical protein